jgi:plasmid maintenance system antidote protein VapI
MPTKKTAAKHDAKAANALLNDVINTKRLKNDAALSRALEVAPPVISKIRHGKLPVGDSMLIRLHEYTGWAIRTMKTSLGLPVLQQATA